jgi:sulfotransferase family protein
MLNYDAVQAAISELRKKQIFFIGGVMKSGTTWLQLLLDAHPQVSCNGEGHFTRGLAPTLHAALHQHDQLIAQKNKTIFNEMQGYRGLGEEDVQYLLASSIALYLLRQSKDKTAARAVGEKSPKNVLYFDVFDSLFPGAKFIHIVRDGRDCAISGWFHNLRVARDLTKKNHESMNFYVTNFIDGWAKDVGAAQLIAEAHPARVRQVRYEDLAANTEQVLANLLQFLDVDVDASVLAQCCSAASFAKLSGGREVGQENLASFFRKGAPGDWRNHLSPEMQVTIRQRAGEWLDRFGYD